MTSEIREYMERRFNQLQTATLLAAKNVIDVEEAAMLTGYTVKGIYTLTSEKRIPHYKKNGKLYFRKDEVEAWMTENKVLTLQEIESRAQTYIVTRRKSPHS